MLSGLRMTDTFVSLMGIISDWKLYRIFILDLLEFLIFCISCFSENKKKLFFC